VDVDIDMNVYGEFHIKYGSMSQMVLQATMQIPKIESNNCLLLASRPLCVVARTYSSSGDRAFAAAGPVLWNSLPSHLKEADLLYSQFWRSLKTFLFG